MKEVPRIVNGNTSPADNGNFVEDSKSKKSCLKLFSLQGRTDKKNFFKGVLVSDFVIILLIGAFHDNPLLACLVTALIYGCTVPLRARRLHDRGMSAGFSGAVGIWTSNILTLAYKWIECFMGYISIDRSLAVRDLWMLQWYLGIKSIRT